MRMMWSSYYEKAACVLVSRRLCPQWECRPLTWPFPQFVVDAAEPSLIAEAAAELAELAADPALVGKPIAVVANKRDLGEEVRGRLDGSSLPLPPPLSSPHTTAGPG